MTASPDAFGLVLSALLVAGSPLALEASADAAPAVAAAAAAPHAVPFLANTGQRHADVAFYARTPGGTTFVTRDGRWVHAVAPRAGQAVAVQERLLASRSDGVTGLRPASVRVSEFRGADPARWRSGIPAYGAVGFGEVYEGIELELRATRGHVERRFQIAPGAGTEDIRVAVAGAESLRVTDEGELEIRTALGPLHLTRPVAWQPAVPQGAPRREVEVAFAVKNEEAAYGFALGEYDRSRPLVIDPLIASTYLGGQSVEGVAAIALDKAGSVFATGVTTSLDFPSTPGVYQPSHAGGEQDVFVARLRTDLRELQAATYLGGSGEEEVEDMVHFRDLTSGEEFVYLVGTTFSHDFPTTPGAWDRAGDPVLGDAWLAKLDEDLVSLVAATYLGELSGEDLGKAIDVIRDGSVYVVGTTDWDEDAAPPATPFPTTFGAFDRVHDSTTDSKAFVTRLDPPLEQVVASTLLGGSLSSRTDGETVDAFRLFEDEEFVQRIYVAGDTQFNAGEEHMVWGFPTTPGAFERDPSMAIDGFVSRFSEDLTELVASTYLAGSQSELLRDLVVHSDRTVYVTGDTNSDDYPTTEGAYDRDYNDELGLHDDLFVTRLEADLTALRASTYFGGSMKEWSPSIDLDFAGNAYLTGIAGFFVNPQGATALPTTPGAWGQTHNGQADAFVSVLSANLGRLVFSTFLGIDSPSEAFSSLPRYSPTGLDFGEGIEVDRLTDDIYIGGITFSGDPELSPIRSLPPDPPTSYQVFPVLPVPRVGYVDPTAYDITFNGMADGFVAKLVTTPEPGSGVLGAAAVLALAILARGLPRSRRPLPGASCPRYAPARHARSTRDPRGRGCGASWRRSG